MRLAKHVIATVIALGAALSLAACATTQQIAASTCATEGLQPGTKSFDSCIGIQETDLRQERKAMMAGTRAESQSLGAPGYDPAEIGMP